MFNRNNSEKANKEPIVYYYNRSILLQSYAVMEKLSEHFTARKVLKSRTNSFQEVTKISDLLSKLMKIMDRMKSQNCTMI